MNAGGVWHDQMTKHDRPRHKFGQLSIAREFQLYLRGERAVVIDRRDPTACYCGRRALYRTNAGNEGRCREHREVK